MKKYIVCTGILSSLWITSCISTKSTIKNIDNTVTAPKITADNHFEITKFSTNKKYGYHQDYPVNVGFTTLKEGVANENRFLDALQGPNGEKISYKMVGKCCPFPTKKTKMGSGLLDQYEITWKGQKKPMVIYLNSYEKGELMIPVGLSPKK